MYHFYTDKSNISDKQISVFGEDVNHIKNVLRMQIGEELIICDGEGVDYHCRISEFGKDYVNADILEFADSEAEMPFKVYLFQGLPKKDKMEMIIQKTVELGVYEIIPVMTKRVIVKLDDPKKEAKKLERWQAIAESGAKQSGRGIIPKVHSLLSFKEAIKMAKDMDMAIIPYENADSSAEGMRQARELIESFKDKGSVAVFIGPEGGFEASEVEFAMENGVKPVTLGKRILRTETAGLMVLSTIGFLAN